MTAPHVDVGSLNLYHYHTQQYRAIILTSRYRSVSVIFYEQDQRIKIVFLINHRYRNQN